MTETQTKSSAKTVFFLLLGIPVVVIALSTLVYFMADKGQLNLGTVNRGELLDPPMQLAELEPLLADGSELPFNRADSLWNFVVIGSDECTGACERMLYLTRQTHVALGKKMDRVGRIYLNTEAAEGAALQQLIESEHDDLVVARIDAPALAAALTEVGVDIREAGQFYLVDPKGWLMMVYRAESLDQDSLNALGKDVLKDMRRLLR